MSSNFVRFQKIQNQAFAEIFTCLSQKLVNPLFYLSPYFLLHILFSNSARTNIETKCFFTFSGLKKPFPFISGLYFT